MSNKDAVRSIKSRLAGLKRGRRFIDYHESGPYARELENLLDEIDSIAESPRQGVELVTAFMQTDNAVLGRADDSNGSIGDVYRIFACDSFIRHASQCEDKEWLYNVVLKLYADDENGVHDSIIANSANFLPESYLRRMVDEFWSLGDREPNEYQRYHWYGAIEDIARQLKDPPLFEKACRARRPQLSTAAHRDIAEVYLECGYPLVALQWLNKVPPDETFQLDEREQLLLKVLTELGDKARAEEVAWRIFRRSRSKTRLSLLLNVIGESQHERIVDSEIEIILKSPTLDYVDALFLFELERFAEAERYLTERTDQLNGDYYYQLLPWAKTFEKHEKFLMASILYRALLESILRRAKSKYYTYGVRYLRKLDDLAPRVGDWGEFVNHEDYKLNLLIEHKLKRSFWARYDQ
ncbi:MAG: DUF6880 family protein [Candidatus Zixiibacteriota bacterium]